MTNGVGNKGDDARDAAESRRLGGGEAGGEAIGGVRIGVE